MYQELPTARPPKAGVLWSLAIAHVLGIVLIWIWWDSTSLPPSPLPHPQISTNHSTTTP
jgi:hypothetical protein